MVNYQALAAEHDRQKRANENNLNRRLVAINDAIEHLGVRHPVVEAIEVILNIKPGGTDKVTELLGLTVTIPDDSGPKAITDGTEDVNGKERPLPVFNADGSNAGVGLYRDQAKTAGYGAKFGPDGITVVGWQKPPADAPAPTAPTTIDLDQLVPLFDKKGRQVGEIKVYDGKRQADLTEKVTDDPSKGFKPRPWSVRK